MRTGSKALLQTTQLSNKLLLSAVLLLLTKPLRLKLLLSKRYRCSDLTLDLSLQKSMKLLLLLRLTSHELSCKVVAGHWHCAATDNSSFTDFSLSDTGAPT